MSGWNKAELFALPPSVYSEYYVRKSANWQEESNCWLELTAPAPPVVLHQSDVVLRDEGGTPAIWHIVIAEYVVIALLCFLTAARDAAVGVACINPWMGGSGRSVPVPLPSGIHREVDDIGLLEILGGSCCDPVASLIAFSWSSNVDWAWVEPTLRAVRTRSLRPEALRFLTDDCCGQGGDNAGNDIAGSEVQPMCAVCWRFRGSLCLERSFICGLWYVWRHCRSCSHSCWLFSVWSR